MPPAVMEQPMPVAAAPTGAFRRTDPPAPRRKHDLPLLAGSILLHVFVLFLALLSLAPFFWLISATFKNSEDFFNYAFLPWAHPERWTLENYRWLFREEPFLTWMFSATWGVGTRSPNSRTDSNSNACLTPRPTMRCWRMAPFAC